MPRRRRGAVADAPAWPAARERRLAGRALWSAVHGIVTANFFGGTETTARKRTTTLLRLPLTTIRQWRLRPRGELERDSWPAGVIASSLT